MSKENVIKGFEGLRLRKRVFFLNNARKLYNKACKDCKIVIAKKKGAIPYEELCDHCKERLTPILERMKKLLDNNAK